MDSNIIHMSDFTSLRGGNRTENPCHAAATALTGADTLAERAAQRFPAMSENWHHVSEAAERALARLRVE